jgi:hypothetical protein
MKKSEIVLLEPKTTLKRAMSVAKRTVDELQGI